MSQTVTQKPCTESKTRLGAKVHTQRTPGCAYGAPMSCTPPRIVVRNGAVSWPSTGRVAVCGQPCRKRAAPCRTPAWPYRGRCCGRIAASGCAVSRHSQRPNLLPVTIQDFVSRHSLPVARPSPVTIQLIVS